MLMDSPLADWGPVLDEHHLAPRVSALVHPGRDAEEVLRDMLVLVGAVRFAEALRSSPDAFGQNTARENLKEMCIPVEATVERLTERIRRNEAQRNAICTKVRTLIRMADDKAGWLGAIYSYGLHRPLAQEVICMCQAAEIGVDPDFYQKNLPRAAKQALEWLRERF